MRVCNSSKGKVYHVFCGAKLELRICYKKILIIIIIQFIIIIIIDIIKNKVSLV